MLFRSTFLAAAFARSFGESMQIIFPFKPSNFKFSPSPTLLKLTRPSPTTPLPASAAADDCNSLAVDFIILDGDATITALEDDIRADLEKVGVTVNLRALQR